MLIFIKILLIVYILAINVYSFILIHTQKTSREAGENKVSDGKLFVAALMGGSIAIYTALFVFKYRLSNLALMVFIPVIIAINAYIIYLLFASNFGFIINQPYGIANLL